MLLPYSKEVLYEPILLHRSMMVYFEWEARWKADCAFFYCCDHPLSGVISPFLLVTTLDVQMCHFSVTRKLLMETLIIFHLKELVLQGCITRLITAISHYFLDSHLLPCIDYLQLIGILSSQHHFNLFYVYLGFLLQVMKCVLYNNLYFQSTACHVSMIQCLDCTLWQASLIILCNYWLYFLEQDIILRLESGTWQWSGLK